MKKQLLLGGLMAALLWLTGCATGVVQSEAVNLPQNAFDSRTPILVKKFDASKAVFDGDYSDMAGKVQIERERVPGVIQLELVNYLDEHGYNAENYASGAPADALVVDGTVTRVDAGSGAARFWVGMGAGSSQVIANVEIYRESAPTVPLAKLTIEGHSGGTGGIYGYQDWIGANCKDLAIRLGKYIIEEDTKGDN